MFQYAMRVPCGDTRGWTASPRTNRRGSPPSTDTVQSSLKTKRRSGPCGPSPLAYTIDLPSGNHAGWKPPWVRRLTDSPVRPIRKMPPPSRVDRKAMVSPSGENAGAVWSLAAPLVRLIAV